jgi:hypothetical protein
LPKYSQRLTEKDLFMQQHPPYATQRRVGFVMGLAITALILVIANFAVDMLQQVNWVLGMGEIVDSVVEIKLAEARQQEEFIANTATTAVATGFASEPILETPAAQEPGLAVLIPTNTPATAPIASQIHSAGEIMSAFQSAGLPIADVVAYTVETDPNSLLGRPNQYIEKISWRDTRIAGSGEPGTMTGGTIEIFVTAEDLRARKDYVDAVTKTASVFVEYSYDFGVVLLRLAHDLTPDQAQGYENVLKAFLSGKALPVVATSTPTAGEPVIIAPKDARDSIFVHGNNSPQLPPGEHGMVSVIAFGRMQGNSLPIAVRNNTATYATNIHISGVARAGDGSMLATGGDQGIYPNLVQPGEVAFGYVYFGDATLPDGTTFEFHSEYQPAGSSIEEFDNVRDLEVVEASFVENRIVGLLRNQYAASVSSSVSVDVMCFDESSQIIGHYDSYTDQDTAAAGATVPYQVELRNNPCPVFLVTANGRIYE